MTTRKSALDSASEHLMQTLWWMQKQKFKPVLLHPRSKAAVDRKYTTIDYKPPDDGVWRNGDYGLGCVTGPKAGGPIDGDLDCEEALFFAPRFLPHTDAVFGRAGKLRSHWLYRVDTPTFDKKAFLDPGRTSDNTIVEMRGDGGHQTVFPGSIHQDTGEEIWWSGPVSPEVTTVSSIELDKAFRKIAIATLIVRYIWMPGYHNEPCKHLSGLFFYLEWSLDEAEQMIAAVMEYSNDTDKSRMQTVRLTYRRGEEGKKISGAGVLRKQVKNDPVIDKLLEWAGSHSVNVLQDYNDRFAVVNVEGKFRIADTDIATGEPPVFHMKDDFLNLMATDTMTLPNTDKPVMKARVWLANPRRRQYKSVDFVPGGDDNGAILNLWTGWGVEPIEGDCKAWLDLLKTTICGGDKKLYNWMLHWFANILREPLKKSLTAPVIIGPEGAGKSLLLGYFGRILGPGYVTVTNEEHVYGRFNKHISTALLLHSEEALYGGEKKHAGIIRSLITDEFRIFEPKGIDARRVRNYLRLVLTSNEAHAAPAKPGDRRYTVVAMQDRKASERQVENVLKELDSSGPSALFKFLLDMPYDPKIARINVKNDALTEMKSINMTPVEAWWYDALYEGNVLPDYLSWAVRPERERWPEEVAGPALYAALSINMRERQKRGVPTETMLALSLNRMTGAKLLRSQRSFDNPMMEDAPQMVKLLNGRMSAIVNMPGLQECRKAFEAYLGQGIDWPKEDDTPPKKREPHEKF